MPSVVVLIPGRDGDLAGTQPSLTSPSKQPHSLSQATTPPSVPSRSSPPSKSTASSLAAPSVSYTSRPPSSRPRQPLHVSTSSASLSFSSSLSRQPSSSSSTSSSSVSNGSQRSRKAHHDTPIDISDPFGSDAYMSSRRSPATGQDLYTCLWRLRDKKGVLDPKGHTFCGCQLMTADLLAKHVLTQHIVAAQPYSTHSVQRKIACKWGGCFNRHYDPPGLAAHLVHDHFTHQMGLKYACVAQHCSIKTVLTSHEALERHHTQYHSSATQSNQIRPFWQPTRALKDNKRASQLLAAIQKLDAAGSTVPRIPVSDSANPRFTPSSQRARMVRAINLKQKCFDPFDLRPGQGQDGQPWIRFYKRIQKCSEYDADLQAAHDAVFRATSYDELDLDRLHSQACDGVDLAHNSTLWAIEKGLQEAQLYQVDQPSSQQQKKSHHLSLPPETGGQVLLPPSSPESRVESISAASLASVEREMSFDASMSKQYRWVDSVIKMAPRKAAKGATTSTHFDDNSDSEEVLQDWAPPLRLQPYHTSSRCRFPIAEEETACQGRQRAIRRRAPQNPRNVSKSSSLSTQTSRSSSLSRQAPSSSLTPLSHLGVLSLDAAPLRFKRELQDDDSTLLDGRESDLLPPTSRIKLEEDAECFIDLTSDSGDETLPQSIKSSPTPVDEMRSITPLPVFVELESNALVETSPNLDRHKAAGKVEHCLTSISQQPILADVPVRNSCTTPDSQTELSHHIVPTSL
ncbi:uncharacterized protein UTRI_01211_B [Ustilago trichophora]|uniref:Uncharacterized protein n=1 Tax=Ustilago trichophora TaxID=86804 RepID=A0A5C3DX02_9BASI|nr:uncharacterized protein UTRI_01211_B [Ustilago trichophora]